MQAAQKRYKKQYDKKVRPATYRVGEWVLIKFPAEESGKMRKLSRPWHGPYRITDINGPNVSASQVYHPKKEGIKVQQSRVKHCPHQLPAGFYWYGGKSSGPGRPPKWVENLLAGKDADKGEAGDENKSSDKQAERDVTKASIGAEDLPVANESIDTGSEGSPSIVTEQRAEVPAESRDPQARGQNTHYGLRQRPCRNKKWKN